MGTGPEYMSSVETMIDSRLRGNDDDGEEWVSNSKTELMTFELKAPPQISTHCPLARDERIAASMKATPATPSSTVG